MSCDKKINFKLYFLSYKMKFVILLVVCLSAVLAFENYCSKLELTNRQHIFGSRLANINEIKQSAGKVFFSQTGGETCHLYNCLGRVINQRTLDMNNNFSDFRDNFLIGGNGMVYEGLGWKARNSRYKSYKNDLSVVFIGDFDNKTLPEVMQIAAKHLVLCGIQKRYIDYFFSLYSENDLKCNNNTDTTNGIDLYLQNLTNYARGGPLITCT